MARLLCAALLVSAAAGAAPRPAKKLLEYGWDVPYPDQVRDLLRVMEQKPFDGLVFRLRETNHAFDPRPWDSAAMQAQIDQLAGIEWRRFTDNFLTLYAANDQGMDWFNDAQWEQIAANMRLHARAARAAGCVGIGFDYEPYGANPWAFQAAAGRSWAETAAVVRRRGAQFMNALQADWPDLKLLTLFQFSFLLHVCDIVDPAAREERLAGESYGLLPAFVNGLLDAAGPGVRIIDGNEASYYYERADSFYRAYHAIRQRCQSFIEPPLRDRYEAQVRVGMALYVDQILNLRQNTPLLAAFCTPDERLAWWEHNVWHALNASDEYVWLYSERMNWWQGPIPEGLEERVRSALERYRAGLGPGIDLEPILAAARRREQEQLAARLGTREAAIAPAATAPAIDGRLDDACWQGAPLERFVRIAGATGDQAPEAGTAAWLAFDNEHLYVAFRCDEPAPANLVRRGARKDDPVWEGDCVELFWSLGPEPTPYRHFIVSPANVPWDGQDGGAGDDPSWHAEWRSQTLIADNHWCAELAIPWAVLGGPPAAGGTRRANLCRQRGATGELSTWCPVVRGFIEPERMGMIRS